MAQATTLKPKEAKTCSTCEHFKDYKETNGRALCLHLDQIVYAHHPKTIDCPPSETTTTKPEVNSDIFANYSPEEQEALREQAFPTEVIELDRDGYPMGEQTVENAYFNPNFVVSPNAPF